MPKTLETFTDYDRLKGRLELFRTLEEGWDSGSAPAPFESTIASADVALSLLGGEILQNCSLFPANDGGIYLTGHFKNESKFAVYFIDDSMTYIVKNTEDKTGGEDVTVTTESIKGLKSDICRICL